MDVLDELNAKEAEMVEAEAIKEVASFPGSRSRKGEESLVTLGGGSKPLTSGASSFM